MTDWETRYYEAEANHTEANGMLTSENERLKRLHTDAFHEAERWKDRYQEEYAIVDRVWKALGIAGYEEAGGEHIDDLVRARVSYAELQTEALREIHRTAHGFDHPALLRIVGLTKMALAKEPTTQFSAHPAGSDAGVKLTPAETVRYDPAPECKGEIAARERLEPEGRRGADGTVSVAELDAQNGVTGRRDGHFLHQSGKKPQAANIMALVRRLPNLSGEEFFATRDAIQAALEQLDEECVHQVNREGPKPLYRHVNRGTLYRLLWCNVFLEWSPGRPYALYQSEETAQLWVRPESEFFDGRFIEAEDDSQSVAGKKPPEDVWRTQAVLAMNQAVLEWEGGKVLGPTISLLRSLRDEGSK